MPLFSRSDGTLIKTEPLVRQIMPYLMPTRTDVILADHGFALFGHPAKYSSGACDALHLFGKKFDA